MAYVSIHYSALIVLANSIFGWMRPLIKCPV